MVFTLSVYMRYCFFLLNVLFKMTTPNTKMTTPVIFSLAVVNGSSKTVILSNVLPIRRIKMPINIFMYFKPFSPFPHPSFY